MTCNEELAAARYEERPAGRNEEPATPVMKTAVQPQNTQKSPPCQSKTSFFVS
ncbi:MAG: hypothetical protein IJB31_00630 [Akkermansia sp.]|nr:hypothetical protein [Akkermansia sp.]